TLP
ncbi:hypothetical protein VC95412_000244B, partial [Vibrio cholerae O1 str. 95412]